MELVRMPRRDLIVFAIFAVVVLTMPIWLQPLGAAYPALMQKFVISAVFAIGFNILFGLTGYLSFGHAAFLGVGSYTAVWSFKLLTMDAIPAIIIVGTILQPLAQSVGMDPVHFAIIGIVSLAFGLVTPPYGLCLMVACAVAKIRLVDALKDTMIFLVPMLLVLAAIIVWPSIPLFLPRLFPPGTL